MNCPNCNATMTRPFSKPTRWTCIACANRKLMKARRAGRELAILRDENAGQVTGSCDRCGRAMCICGI